MTTTPPPNPQAIARLDPQALLAKAIETGAGIDTLERLVTLAKDIRQVTAREAYFEAIAQFKRDCPRIKKDATANAGQYSYSYATLDGILDTVDPLLSQVGLTVSWKQKHEGNAVHASCLITHKLGHQEESGFVAVPFETTGRMNPAQRVGSAATYAKRYSLLAVLGLAPEDDDDARGTQAPPAREPVDEAQASLPTPDEDRAYLIAEIKRLAKNIPAGDKAEAALTYGINDTLDKTDTAALNDLLGWMRTRVKK